MEIKLKDILKIIDDNADNVTIVTTEAITSTKYRDVYDYLECKVVNISYIGERLFIYLEN